MLTEIIVNNFAFVAADEVCQHGKLPSWLLTKYASTQSQNMPSNISYNSLTPFLSV